MRLQDQKSTTLNDALLFANDLYFYAEDKNCSQLTRNLLKQSADVITALVEGYKSYQRPIGHWEVKPVIAMDTWAKCSHCGEGFYYRNDGICQVHRSLYCPHCGAYMGEEETT